MSLGLTLIVRDEAERLGPLLDHHRGLADAVLVVDTGSVDGTAAVARQAGAAVVEHPWRDDFAAARNAGLDALGTDWVLFLDADERIAARDFAAVRAATETGAAAWLQETWNYCGREHLEWRPVSGRYPAEEAGQAGYFVARRVGLFPLRADLRFSGRVHESVLPAVERAGLALRPLDVPVHHYGFAGGAEANAARRERYRRLVALKLADDPDDAAARLEWATVLIEDGEAPRALPVLESLAAESGGRRPVVRGLVLLARLRRESGAAEAARDLLREALRRDPAFLPAHLAAVRGAADDEDWERAESLLRDAAAHGGGDDPRLLQEAVRVHSHRRHLGDALGAAERLVALCPQWHEMRAVADRLRTIIRAGGESAGP
ncbi:glycosyltransferase [bacterium]|nr:glycosyltransferase [bacterium]